MDHNPSSRVSFGCPDSDIEELDVIAEDRDESRSELLRTLVAEFVDEHRDTDDEADEDDHLPTSTEHRRVYLQALESSTKKLRLHERHFGTVAQQLQSVNKEGVRAVLQDLRRKGYVSMMGHPPDCDTRNLSTVYRVKPRVVDPDEWTYSEQKRNERRDISDLLSSDSPTEKRVCDRCGSIVYRDSDCECGGRDTCECGVVLNVGEDQCPNCRAVSGDVIVDA
ncbi:ribbon-helix-helix domain-containing protein [Haloarchaeobius sp. TZWSO28]|uniref:ribbon-helix-helix domain-containing protein n=1 Tax=Haloarchaeobius sp. TZWSO28 TaxID=3446119 RepID=UPI003EC120C1